MGEKTAGDRKIIQGKEKTDEYQRSKRNDNTYAAGVFSEGGKRISAGSTAAATADPDARTSGNRKDCHHGTDRRRMWRRTGGVHDDTSYETECHGTAENCGADVWRHAGQCDRIYDE